MYRITNVTVLKDKLAVSMKSHKDEPLKRLDRGKSDIVFCCQEPEYLLLEFALVVGKGWPPSSFLRQTWHNNLSDCLLLNRLQSRNIRREEEANDTCSLMEEA